MIAAGELPHQLSGTSGGRFAPGLGVAGRPVYFVLLDWSGDRILQIRDFRYARYVIGEAEFTTLG